MSEIRIDTLMCAILTIFVIYLSYKYWQIVQKYVQLVDRWNKLQKEIHEKELKYCEKKTIREMNKKLDRIIAERFRDLTGECLQRDNEYRVTEVVENDGQFSYEIHGVIQ